MKRLLSYILFFVGVLLLGTAGFMAWHASSAPASTAGDVPATVAGFSLVQKQTGDAALASIKQLHVGEFALTSAVVATYGQQNATLWVAESASAAQAAELIASMETSIAGGGTPFTPVSVFQFSGREVYMLEGLGQSHFYFQSGRQVIWLGVETAAAEQALKELLAFYP